MSRTRRLENLYPRLSLSSPSDDKNCVRSPCQYLMPTISKTAPIPFKIRPRYRQRQQAFHLGNCRNGGGHKWAQSQSNLSTAADMHLLQVKSDILPAVSFAHKFAQFHKSHRLCLSLQLSSKENVCRVLSCHSLFYNFHSS
jgi:hypothetical protein